MQKANIYKTCKNTGQDKKLSLLWSVAFLLDVSKWAVKATFSSLNLQR